MAGRRFYLFGVFALAVAFFGLGTRSTSAEAASGSSVLVQWSCTGSPCPWGTFPGNPAIVWPASSGPTNARHGYTVSAGVYLPAVNANGMTITLSSGIASAYAGTAQCALAPSAWQHQSGIALERDRHRSRRSRQCAELRLLQLRRQPGQQSHRSDRARRSAAHSWSPAGSLGDGDVVVHGEPVPVGYVDERCCGSLAGDVEPDEHSARLHHLGGDLPSGGQRQRHDDLSGRRHGDRVRRAARRIRAPGIGKHHLGRVPRGLGPR